ncbi:MAG: hypothetical protein LBQ46_10685 [Treponema sp.]|jgi:hypothetical protein|nr:hypothetical protein [Treponema sp.]
MRLYAYETRGQLNSGFQGYIEYRVYCAEEADRLHISLCFDKREYLGERAPFLQSCLEALRETVPDIKPTDQALDYLLTIPKTEVNLAVFFNDLCLGSAFRDSKEKNIALSAAASSPGFIPWRPQAGILRVVICALRILNDNTEYILRVTGEKDDL